MIYFIADGGYGEGSYVKVGYSENDANARLSALQVGNPKELSLWWQFAGNIGTEKFVHRLFAEFHVRGEWFLYTEDFVNLAVELNDAVVGFHKEMFFTDDDRLIKVANWVIDYLKQKHTDQIIREKYLMTWKGL